MQIADNKASNEIPITRTPEVKGSLGEVAQQVGEPLVGLHGETVTTTNEPRNTNASSNQSKPVVVATAAGKQYKAEEGDSVSSMARKFLGANTKANRDAIINANVSLQQNPDRIIVGTDVSDPERSGGDTRHARTVAGPGTGRRGEAGCRPAQTESANTAADNIYVVKAGDNLSKIAVMQCGNGAAVTAIRDLNKDILKDSDTIQVGMKLRLPSKPLASAAN